MAKRRSRRAGLAAASIAVLEQALTKRRRAAEHLQARRDRLAARLADIDAELEAVRGKAGPGRPPAAKAARAPRHAGRRGRRGKISLAAIIAQVLKEAGKPMAIAQVLEAVKAAGYTSNAKHFHAMVQMTLGKLEAARRVGRGMYVYRTSSQ